MSDYRKFYFEQIKAQTIRINNDFENEPESKSFLRFCSSIILNLEPEDLDEYITDDYDDLGADAIYFNLDDEAKNFRVIIIQSKYNKKNAKKTYLTKKFLKK